MYNEPTLTADQKYQLKTRGSLTSGSTEGPRYSAHGTNDGEFDVVVDGDESYEDVLEGYRV